MRNALLWAAVLCLATSVPAHAAELPAKNQTPKTEKEAPPEAPAMDMEKMQEDMHKVQQQIQQQQKESLERLKQMDSKAYESQKESMDRQSQINQIISAYQQKSISADDAERKLTPLVKQEVQQEMAGIDSQIKTAEKKLASLKQSKGNPSALVKKRVDQMLGRGGPPNPDDMMF